MAVCHKLPRANTAARTTAAANAFNLIWKAKRRSREHLLQFKESWPRYTSVKGMQHEKCQVNTYLSTFLPLWETETITNFEIDDVGNPSYFPDPFP